MTRTLILITAIAALALAVAISANALVTQAVDAAIDSGAGLWIAGAVLIGAAVAGIVWAGRGIMARGDDEMPFE